MEKLFKKSDFPTWEDFLKEGSKSDPAALAKMRADAYNASQGTLAGYHCKACKDRGGFLESQSDGTTVYRECGCMPVRKSLLRMEASGLKDVIREKTFEKFQVTESWQKTICQGARAYGEKPEGWFLLCGQSGSGKTHLCTAICREQLLKGIPVQYLPWREEISLLKSYEEPEKRDKRRQELQRAEFLYIDDLFKTGKSLDGLVKPSSADVNAAFELLNSRYISRLPTVISTELTTRELLGVDEALGGRILELAGDNVFQVKRDPRRNFRLRRQKTA